MALRGEVDIATENDAELGLLESERSQPAQILVDRSGLVFMDVTGARLILRAYARLGGRVRLLNASQVRRLFDLAGADALLTPAG